MTARKKTSTRKSNQTRQKEYTLLQQCRQLPGQMRQVCVDAALARYERHYHPEREHHRKHVIVDAILAAALLVSIVFSLFFLFSFRQAGLHQRIDFVLSPNTTAVVSGDALTISLFAQNNTDQDLTGAYVTLPAASGFVLARTRPEQDQDGRIMLGTLKPGQNASITADGSVVGAVDGTLRVNAVLHYRANALLNFEEKLITESVEVKDSHLRLTLDMPRALVPDHPFDFTLAYENTSSLTGFDAVRVIPLLPAGWETLESEPAFAAETLIWELGHVGALQFGSVRGRAVMRDTGEEKALVNFKLYAAPFGKPLLQAEAQNVVPVHQPKVLVRLSGTGQTAALGDRVTQTLTVVNDEAFALREMSVVFAVNTDLIDRSVLPKGAVVENGKVTMPLALILAADTPLTQTVSWKLREQINPAAVFGNAQPLFRVAGEISYRNVKNDLVVIPLDPLVMTLQSDARVQAVARYFGSSGEQIGRGPLPPAVGETTKYWVFLHVANQINPLTAASVEALLPAGIDWTGRYTLTAGELVRYDATTRRVSWILGDVADYKNDFTGETLSAGFEVAVTPGKEDVGQTMVLLGQAELQARDTAAGIVINATTPEVDTKLQQDAYAKDDGRVRL